MWSAIVSVFHTIFYEPLLNGLIFLIDVLPLHDVGIAVIILTVIVKFIILPFNHKAIVVQHKMRELEPELKKIKEKYKKDNQVQAKETMDLYRRHGINPFSGFVTILVQLPIIIALYRVFLGGVDFDPAHIYSFMQLPEIMELKFLGMIDMAQKSYLLAILAGVSQFLQMKLMIPPIKNDNKNKNKDFKSELAKSMNMQMRYVFPVLIVFIALKFSAAVALYWTTMNVFAIVHESIVRKKAKEINQNNNNNNGKTKGNNKIIDRSDPQ